VKKHQKHTNLIKPEGGKYHRCEIGLIGAPCGMIKETALKVNEAFKANYNIGFMDADHNSDGTDSGYHTLYTDKIDFHQFSLQEENPDFSFNSEFQACDILLINGNHFDAGKQIVFITEKKKESLKRKLNRLTNVIAFVLDSDINAPHSFLKESLKDYSNIPILKITDQERLLEILQSVITSSIAPITGLLLYGGKSQRMGSDKGEIDYHGLPHSQYLADILNDLCENVIVSISEQEKIGLPFDQIKDSFIGLGPFGGILSAFRNNPNKAYLILPCDVPFITKDFVQNLIDQRDSSKVATCYHNRETGFPEPLITIWEPRAYPRLLRFLALGYSCPRKVLINSNVKEILPSDDEKLFNANTKEEAEMALERINNLGE